MKLYYVYILECGDKSLYTGITNNLDRRLLEHQKGQDNSCYTYSRRPVKLVFHAEFTDVNMAISSEKQIKRWSRTKKIALINNEIDKLPNLAKKKFNN
ncbi:GIY-YIG nuclease family protein [Winogradskyella aurantia]|uniref:GIY-YIG domain-containing protein n=1 Tax=Winogradskyella aurantia TaxID=1915063 RepID=A0A265UV88_9FLAO|nr:GIY-YIG nuclease family protein [Winogradskyella aurantia]OZV69229.1 hypothetical protein CA834_07165 [Winogradskyella aurantia]